MSTTRAPLPPGPPGAAVVPFHWSEVPPGDRDWLRRRTEDVLGLAYRQACDIVRIGTVLEEARRKLERGRYLEWVARVLPFSVAQANRYRQVAKAFAGYQTSQFEKFDPSALYVLAQTRAVPKGARDHAVQLVERGERVTHALAVQIVQAHRAPEPARKERAADMTALARRMRPIREAEAAQREQVAKEGEGPGARAERLARLGEALAHLAGTCAVVHVTRIDEDEDAPLYSVTTYREDAAPRNAVRRALLDALLAAGDREPTKVCPTCPDRAPKPLSQFGVLASSPDGRNRCCKVCERARIAGVKKKRRRGAPGGGGAPAAGPTP